MDDEKIRIAALWHSGLGLARTKVIFRDGSGVESAYWMDRDIYDLLPIGEKTTLAQYRRLGKVDEAENTDIYSNL